MATNLLASTLEQMGDLDGAAMESARMRQQRIAKPDGSLGRLEALSVQLAGISGSLRPPLSPRTVIVCAADHGVVSEKVSAFPKGVTHQMVLNFLAGGATINVLARQLGAKVVVLDVGVDATLPQHMLLHSMKVRPGTGNIAKEQAMTRAEVLTAIEAGIAAANAEIQAGAKLIVVGEMGIGNTTPSAAIAAVITGVAAEEVTGQGTGLGLAGWRRKCAVVAQALELHQPDVDDPIDILSKIGGLEIAAAAGVILAAAAARVPVLLDGIVSTAAAALAVKFAPDAKNVMIAGHRSTEPGHRLLLNVLDLMPILDMDMRLGEGTGGILAIPILEAALSTLNEVATFEEAQITLYDNREAGVIIE